MYGATRNDPAAPVASPNTIKNAIIVPANSACCGCTHLKLTADKFKNQKVQFSKSMNYIKND